MDVYKYLARSLELGVLGRLGLIDNVKETIIDGQVWYYVTKED